MDKKSLVHKSLLVSMKSRSAEAFSVVLLLHFLFISNLYAYRQEDSNQTEKEKINISVTVDPRIEMISIIFRLAENTEYNQCNVPAYNRDIKKYFGDYKNHPAVEYAKELRKKYGVGYDAPMSLAIHISDINSLNLLVPLEPRPQRLDSRWKTKETEEFLQKTRQFVQDTNFPQFFNRHKKLYETSTAKFKKMLEENANLQWLDEYFATGSKPVFNVVLGMANGPNNYGPSVVIDNERHIYGIIGVWNADTFGNPFFPTGIVSTVVHEIGHSYVNPIVERNMSKLKPAGKILFPKVKDKMKRMAYGQWQTMMIESVNRACTIQYYYQNDKSMVERSLQYNINKGFYWTRELNEVVSQYNMQRDKYPTFESFFPKIIEFFDTYAKRESDKNNQ